MLSRSILLNTLWISPDILELVSRNRTTRPAFRISALQAKGNVPPSPPPRVARPAKPSLLPTTDLEKAKQLTRDITGANSASQLFTTLDRHRHSSVLSVRHLTTALCRLCRLSQKRTIYIENGAEASESTDENWPQHPIFKWLMNELVDRQEQWPAVSIANVLEACSVLELQDTAPLLLTRAESELRHENSFNFKDIVSIMVSMVKLGYKMASHPWLKHIELRLLITYGNGEISRADNGCTASAISMEHQYELWALAWSLTEMECSPLVADVVFSYYAGQGMKNLQPRELVHFTRLAAERGSNGAALKHALLVAEVLNGQGWQRSLTRLQGAKEKSQAAREVSMLLLNVAKLVRKAASNDLDCDLDAKMWNKVEHGMADIENSNKSIHESINFLLQSTIPLVPIFNTVQVISVITALSYLGRSKAGKLVPALASRATQLSPWMDVAALAMVARALASLQHDSKEFIEAAATALHRNLHCQTTTNNPVVQSGIAALPPASFASLVAILYSFAVVNRFDDPSVQRVLPDVVLRLLSDMASVEASVYDPNDGLSHLIPLVGWSLIVGKGPPGQLTPANGPILQALRAWRRAITSVGPYIPASQLSMVQHVAVALRIECPKLGSDAPAQYDTFLNSLYDSGRLSLRASAEWDAQTEIIIDTTGSGKHGSKFQLDVCKSACAVVPGWQFEYWEKDLCYTVDAALPEFKIALEADGPTHYAINTLRPLGHTTLKARLLSQLGWTVINVPYFEWEKCRTMEEREEYIIDKLESAGVTGAELLGRLAQQQEKKKKEEESRKEQEKVASNNSVSESLVQGSFVSEEGNAIEIDVQKNELSEDTKRDLATVAQRARQLELIKGNQGKLSKTGLAMKTALRNAAQAKKFKK